MRSAGWLWLALCAFWYWHENWQMPAAGIGATESDFFHYHVAARAVLHGESPFARPEFAYPPLIAFLLAPLGALAYVPARWTFFVLSQAALLAAAWVTWGRLGRDLLAACVVALVWAAGGAASESLSLGQIGPVLVLLIAVAPKWEAGAVAAGFALKFFPGVLGWAAVMRRDWRTVAKICAIAAVLVVLPWAAVSFCLTGPSRPSHSDYWMGTPAVLNWSLPAAAVRALDLPVRGELPFAWRFGNYTPNIHLTAIERAVSLGTAAVVLGAGLMMLLRRRVDREIAMAALMSLALAASPVCWSHYQVMQYPGIALVLCRALRAGRWAIAAATVIAGSLLYSVPVSVLTGYYERYGGWTAGAPWVLYFWTAVPAAAALSFFLICVRADRSLSTPLDARRSA